MREAKAKTTLPTHETYGLSSGIVSLVDMTASRNIHDQCSFTAARKWLSVARNGVSMPRSESGCHIEWGSMHGAAWQEPPVGLCQDWPRRA